MSLKAFLMKSNERSEDCYIGLGFFVSFFFRKKLSAFPLFIFAKLVY